MGGLDADGDDPPLSADGGGALARFAEFVDFAKNVVGRQREHKHRGVAIGGESCYATNLNPTTAK